MMSAIVALRFFSRRIADAIRWHFDTIAARVLMCVAAPNKRRWPARWLHAIAMRRLELPEADRWTRLGLGPAPSQAWTSYDRSPWRHPWLTSHNVEAFAKFSCLVLNDLRTRCAIRSGSRMSYGFVGNIANINYMRAAPLRRYGLDIALYLPIYDQSLFSQPAWEDFDGAISELGDDPVSAIAARPVPARTRTMAVSPDWRQALKDGRYPFIDLDHMVAFPEFMPYAEGITQLTSHDALLVTQCLYFGPLSGRPYVIGQMGGDIWFDASRDDALGHFSRLALREAYAVLVSNPLTLSHARRYGLRNCIYLPFCIDEERYRPGEEPDIRATWRNATGGDFFVLTSMRLDNQWKGAALVLEGFARFARTAPGARLVILGWGVDQKTAMARLAELGVLDRVLLLPVVGKARLARYLRAADALIEQFVLGYYGASGLEAMATGLPVIMRIERAQYDALVPSGAPPVLDAENADEVAAHLVHLHESETFRREVGKATRGWFMATHSASATWRDYAAVLKAASLRLRVDWSASPLAGKKSAEEVHYHADQLARAPLFPRCEIWPINDIDPNTLASTASVRPG